MTITIIITLCVLLLFAYLFDVTASKTKIPAGILLLLVGLAVRQGCIYMNLRIPDLSLILPVLGTIGLILIVLEGALNVDINDKSLPILLKSFAIAIIPMLLLSFGLAYLFQYFAGATLKTALINAIPLSVVSSAVAIPSARNLQPHSNEFFNYENSLSDIFGIIFFNFVAFDQITDSRSFTDFSFKLFVMIVVSFVATLALLFFLHKVKHHIKFMPMILFVILIYAIGREYHLPALFFILFFGLFISNIEHLRSIEFFRHLLPEKFNEDVLRFKEMSNEMAFLIRALFFLLFGYLIELSEVFNTETLPWAIGITAIIFLLRFFLLKLVLWLFRYDESPMTYIAPRGLITILVFLCIPEEQALDIANHSLIIQVILLSTIAMLFSLLFQNFPKKAQEDVSPEQHT